MDPITQGTLGAAAALATLGGKTPLRFSLLAWMGAIGGMAADLDILIRSSNDPLLAIEYHRNLTHSFIFIPVGGCVAALPWLTYSWIQARSTFNSNAKWTIAATTIGYATHALLDACTTYGTMLYWPFSDERISFRWVSVVDPLYTLPLLLFVLLCVKLSKAHWARVALVWGALYLGLGAIQQARAQAVQSRFAEERGHLISRGAVFPSIANNITWRSVYKTDNKYYVDKIRVPWWGKGCATPGSKVGVLGPPPTQLPPRSARAERLIRWFANDWVALDPTDATVIGDLRYSFSPTEAQSIWGVRVHPKKDQVEWINNRKKRAITVEAFRELLFDNGPNHRCY